MRVPPRLWTVGHSRHAIDRLIELLEGQGIACLVDVRRIPFSRRHPQHNKEALGEALARRGIEYVWEGEALGGKRDWGEVRASPAFGEALGRLKERARAAPTAILCAEEDPRRCHRLHLVSAAWAERWGEEIFHIRGDGRVERHGEVVPQPGLFGRE